LTVYRTKYFVELTVFIFSTLSIPEIAILFQSPKLQSLMFRIKTTLEKKGITWNERAWDRTRDPLLFITYASMKLHVTLCAMLPCFMCKNNGFKTASIKIVYKKIYIFLDFTIRPINYSYVYNKYEYKYEFKESIFFVLQIFEAAMDNVNHETIINTRACQYMLKAVIILSQV